MEWTPPTDGRHLQVRNGRHLQPQTPQALLQRQFIRAARLGLDSEVSRLHSILGSSIAVIRRDFDGASSVYVAAGMGRPTTCKLLCSLGVDPNLSNNHGWSPLHVAVYRGHFETCKMLASLGAITGTDVRIAGSLFSSLGIANHFAHHDIANFLTSIDAMKANARQGNLAFISEAIKGGDAPPLVQWFGDLHIMHKFLLKGFARRTLCDASACFMVLFAEATELADADDRTPQHAYLRNLRAVTHDGLRHIRQLFASFLVFQQPSARLMTKEIDASGWPCGWRSEFLAESM